MSARSFISRVFGRNTPPSPRERIIPIGPDSPDTWSAGDWAVCIDGGSGWVTAYGEPSIDPPQRNEINRVVEVYLDEGAQLLVFAGKPGQGWVARSFRKIRPDVAEGEREDWELIRESVKRRIDA